MDQSTPKDPNDTKVNEITCASLVQESLRLQGPSEKSTNEITCADLVKESFRLLSNSPIPNNPEEISNLVLKSMMSLQNDVIQPKMAALQPKMAAVQPKMPALHPKMAVQPNDRLQNQLTLSQEDDAITILSAKDDLPKAIARAALSLVSKKGSEVKPVVHKNFRSLLDKHSSAISSLAQANKRFPPQEIANNSRMAAAEIVQPVHTDQILGGLKSGTLNSPPNSNNATSDLVGLLNKKSVPADESAAILARLLNLNSLPIGDAESLDKLKNMKSFSEVHNVISRVVGQKNLVQVDRSDVIQRNDRTSLKNDIINLIGPSSKLSYNIPSPPLLRVSDKSPKQTELKDFYSVNIPDDPSHFASGINRDSISRNASQDIAAFKYLEPLPASDVISRQPDLPNPVNSLPLNIDYVYPPSSVNSDATKQNLNSAQVKKTTHGAKTINHFQSEDEAVRLTKLKNIKSIARLNREANIHAPPKNGKQIKAKVVSKSQPSIGQQEPEKTKSPSSEEQAIDYSRKTRDKMALRYAHCKM